MNLIFLGAPGSGKGTQSDFLIENFNLEHLSTGNLIREAISQGTKTGLKMKAVVESGNLVNDELVVSMVEEKIQSLDKGFIFDGFPRTIPQAQALEKLMKDSNKKLDGVLFLDIDQEILLERLTGRMTCSSCKRPYHKLFSKPDVDGICNVDKAKLITREDDKLENAKVRLETYERQTAPLVEFYEQKGMLIRINANQKPADVTNSIKEALK